MRSTLDTFTNRPRKVGIIVLLMTAIVALPFISSYVTFNVMRSTVTPTQEANGLGVKKLIRQIKTELEEAERERLDKNEAALFQLKDVKVEVAFIVQASTTSTGKLEYKLITVDTATHISQERIQRVELRWDTVKPAKVIVPAAETPFAVPSEDIQVIGKPAPIEGEHR